MWMRRNASVRNGDPSHGNGQMPGEPPFNPNHRRYQACCCHCQAFTIGFGIVELFLICFVLVAVAPDFNSKICEFDSKSIPSSTIPAQIDTTTTIMAQQQSPSTFMQFLGQKRRRRRQTIERNLEQTNMPEVLAILAQKMSSPSSTSMETTTTTMMMMPNTGNSSANEQNHEHERFVNSTHFLRHVTCSLTIFWLIWAILQMVSIALMCYGVKRQRWPLLIPHIFFRICCALVVWLVIAALIGALFQPDHGKVSGYIAFCVFLFLIFLWIAILLKSEIRCCEFVKRSADTGFSISNTRPIGPPTVSQSDSARGVGENVRWVVKSGIRKMPANNGQGPSAKRYQIKQQQQIEDVQNGCEMTTSTLATGSLQTRPSTAGSLIHQQQQNGGFGGGEGRRANSAGTPQAEMIRREGKDEVENDNAETEFGGDDGERPMPRIGVGELPPLRHTYKIANGMMNWE